MGQLDAFQIDQLHGFNTDDLSSDSKDFVWVCCLQSFITVLVSFNQLLC